MGKIRERIIAYVLAFCTLVSAVCTGITMPVSAEEGDGTSALESAGQESTGQGSIDEGFIGLSGYKINIWDSNTQSWKPLTDDMTVKNGDKISIEFSWELANGDTSTELKADITPLKGIQLEGSVYRDLPDLSNASKAVGKYWVENNELHIRLSEDYFIHQSGERKGAATIFGTIYIEDAENEDGDDLIKIGDATANPNFSVEDQTPTSSADVTKTAKGTLTQVEENGKKVWRQTYQVRIATGWNSGAVTNVSLKDELGSNLENMSSFKVVSSNSELFGVGESLTLDEINAKLSGQSIGSEAGYTEIIFEYTVDIKEDKEDGAFVPQPSEEYNNTVTLHYTNNKEEDVDKTSSAKVKGAEPSITKSGVLSEDGKKIIWTITVNLNGTEWDDITDITDIPGAGLKSEGGSIKHLFNEEPPGSGIYVCRYETEITDGYLNSTSGGTVVNKVNMTTSNGGSYDAEGRYTLPAKDWEFKKEGVESTQGAEGTLITWKVTLDIPADAKNVILGDRTDSGHEITGNILVSIDGEQAVLAASGVSQDNYMGLKGTIQRTDIIASLDWQGIHLADALAGKKVEVYYTTRVLAGTSFKNWAKVSYDDPAGSRTRETEASWENSTALSKTGTARNDSYAIDYILKIDLTKVKLPDESGLGEEETIIIEDILPEGLVLDEEIGVTIKDRQVNQWGADQDMYYQGLDWPNPSTVSYKLVEDEDKQKIIFTVPVTKDLLKIAQWANLFPTYNTTPYLYIYYTLKVEDTKKFVTDGKTLNVINNASGTFRGGSIGSDITTTPLTPNPVVIKNFTYEGPNENGDVGTAPYVYYEIEINKEKLDLSPGGDTLQAKDFLGSALSYDLTSIKVYEMRDGEWQALELRTDYRYTYSLIENSLTFTLPDSKHLKITYNALVSLEYSEKNNPFLGEDNSKNTFSLTGYDSNTTKASTTINKAIIKPYAYAEGNTVGIFVQKYYMDDGLMQNLPGAVFRIVRVEWQDNEWKEVTGAGEQRWENLAVGENGKLQQLGLVKGYVYMLEETTAPKDFSPGAPMYFVIPAEDTDKDTLEDLEGKGVKTYASQGTIYYVNEKSTEEEDPKGELVITKTVTGATKEQAEDALEFTVTGPNPDGQSKVYTLKDDVVNYEDGIWTLTLKDLEPGEYTVEETQYKIDGKVTKTVSYTVDGNTTTLVEDYESKEGAQSAIVNVTENGSVTVAYVDEYEELGSLTIQKTVDGNLDWAGALSGEGTWSFEVRDSEEKLVGDSSISSADFNGEGNTRSYTFSGLKPGTYTVTETVKSPEGYTCKTTYSVDVDGEGKASVVVEPGKDSTISVTNTYSKIQEVGSLTLTKTITGGPVWAAIIKDNGLTFVISREGEDGQYTEYKRILGSELGSSDDAHTITLEDLPVGKYKIEEIVSGNVNSGGKDYVLTTVTYQVGGGNPNNCTTDKTTSEITIEKDTPASVTFNNTYAANEGKLILRKKVVGIQNEGQPVDAQAAWDAVKDSLEFVVSKYDISTIPATYKFYESIDGNDSRWKLQDGYMVLELTGLPVGVYKVEETTGTLTDYSVQATECEVSPSDDVTIAQNKLSAEGIEVKRDGAEGTATVTVTFTNTYISNNAELELEKKVEGILDKNGDPATDEAAWNAIKDHITFVISNGTTEIRIEGNKDGWEYDAESHSYKFKVSLSAGTYTVKEQITEITGYTLQTTTYTITVGESEPQTGNEKTTSAVVVKPSSSDVKVSFSNTYEQHKGTLVLTKEVTGLSSDVLKKLIDDSKIKFTIQKVGTEKVYTFTLSEFKDNEDGTYTLMFDGEGGNQEKLPAGTYTIVESDFTLSNYQTKVEYKVEPEDAQGPEGTGDQVSFIIKKDRSTEVTFTNEYTKDPGKLTLQKTVSGDLDWDDVKGTFSIVIDYEGSDSDPKFPMTIEGKDSRWTVSSENVYTLTLEGLEPREYTVTETFKDEKTGYTRTTTYKVNGNSAEADSEGKVKVTVTSNTTGKVDIENNYSQDKGKLVITKTIVGLDEAADAKNTVVSTIKFVVTNTDTKKKVGEYSLSTFGENSGLYTMEIPDLPVGNYTVEETAYTVEGYIISSITYTVNNNGETTLVTNEGEPGAAPAVVIEKGESTTIAFKDTYTKKLPDTGKLILQKIVGGELNYERWNDIKATLSFEVKDSQGKEVEGSPFAASGFTYNDNYKAYVLEIPNLTPGEYTVKELINGKVTDYTCSTTYTVGSGTTTGLPYDEEAGVKVNVPANGDNQVVFTNRYTLDRGNLKITKTIEGDVTKEQAKAITFTVTNGKDYTKEFTLANGEFNYDEPSKTYTLSLENLPVGNYTVTETHYNMDGFITESITYQINGNGEVELVKNDKPTGQTAPTATVEKGQTVTVAYKDVYRAIPKGSLVLEKTVTGNLKWADVKDHISFTVKGPGGYEKTFTAKDFKDDDGDGIYTCTISDLELGTYTITETVTQEEKGYTRTTRYVVGSENAKEGGSAELELTEANPDGKVTFSNDYVQNKGSLQLTKVVTGLSADELNAAIKAGKIKFVIKNKETGIEYPYTLANFASNGSGSYTLIFDGEGTNPGKLPVGDYTIIESDYNLSGYLTGIQYVVTGGASGSDNEVPITINKVATTEVTITNNYTSTKGSLVIQKLVTRQNANDPVIGWDDVKKYLSFVIKDEEGNVVRTISPNEVKFEDLDGDGIYSYTVTGLDAGKTYTVTETSSKVPGYSCTVSFTGEGNVTPSSGNAAEVKATVSETEGTVITFTNTYKKDTPPPSSNTTPSTPNQTPPSPSPSPSPVLQVPPTPSPSKSKEEGGNVLSAERDRVPQTGDYFFMWLSLFLASLSSLISYLLFLNKKNQK